MGAELPLRRVPVLRRRHAVLGSRLGCLSMDLLTLLGTGVRVHLVMAHRGRFEILPALVRNRGMPLVLRSAVDVLEQGLLLQNALGHFTLALLSVGLPLGNVYFA